MNLDPSLIHQLWAILFAADHPISLSRLAKGLNLPENILEERLKELDAHLLKHSPLRLTIISGGYQLCTRIEYADTISHFLKPKKQKLSQSLLEVLAIIAYQQPITLSEIEAIRGVQSDYALKSLIERDFIQGATTQNSPGKPRLYTTTEVFLHAFGLEGIHHLGALNSKDAPPNKDANP